MYKKIKIKRLVVLIIYVLFFIFNKDVCGQVINTEKLLYKTGELKLLLDKQSSAFTFNIHLYKEKKKRLLFIEQTYRGSIDVYDLRNKKLVRAIHLPNVLLREQPIGFYVNNLDSIYILLTKNSKFALINVHDEMIEESIALNDENTIFPVIFTGQPVTKIGDELFICGVFNPDVNNVSSVIVYNIKNNTKHYKLPVSDDYKKGWWGNTLYIPTVSLSYNHRGHLLLSSFPVDNYIYVYNKRGTAEKYFAGSKFIKQVSPFSKKKKRNPSAISVDNYYAKNGYYGALKYDEYQNVYYRYVTRPISKNEDFTSGRKYAIIILNEEFKIIGEWEVPETLDLSKSFVDNSGLCIFNKEKYMRCQDTLFFSVFRINNEVRK